MEQPKFTIGHKVKFQTDHDHETGTVLSFTYDSTNGYLYKITSRYYDATANDMVEGVKICHETELVDMTVYTGSTTPETPRTTVNVTDAMSAGQPAPAQPGEEAHE